MRYNTQSYVLGHAQIRVSNSPIHNLGLFATSPIKKNEIITFYDGEQIDWQTAKMRTDSSYMRSIAFGYSVIDGLRVPSDDCGAGSFINHSSTPNAYFWMRENIVWIKAKTNIYPEEEILVNYGKTYWKRQSDICNSSHVGCQARSTNATTS